MVLAVQNSNDKRTDRDVLDFNVEVNESLLDAFEMKLQQSIVVVSVVLAFRSYDTCRMEDLPPEAATVMKMMQSDAMFLLLSTLTGLQLHELAADSDEEKGASSSAANGNSGSKYEL